MEKGDIMLIAFPFTDLSGNKLRPAVVLAASALDLTVCFITNQLHWQEPSEMVLLPTSDNGLKKQSLLRISKIATIDKLLAKGLLGKLNLNEMAVLNDKLKMLFQIN